MASVLTEKIAAEQDAERDAARDTYVALLHRADAPKPGDTDELASVCGKLGIDGEQFEQDAGVLADFHACGKKAAIEPRIAAKLKRLSEERLKMRGGVPADPRQRAGAEKAYQKIVKARTSAAFKLDRAREAGVRADKLREQHWFLRSDDIHHGDDHE